MKNLNVKECSGTCGNHKYSWKMNFWRAYLKIFRKMQEDEAVKLREQLAESTRQYKAMEDKHQVTLR